MKGTQLIHTFEDTQRSLLPYFSCEHLKAFQFDIYDKDYCHASFKYLNHLIWTPEHERKSYQICQDLSLDWA